MRRRRWQLPFGRVRGGERLQPRRRGGGLRRMGLWNIHPVRADDPSKSQTIISLSSDLATYYILS